MRLALVLPGLAIGFVAVVILGPGNPRPVLAARVHVAPTALAHPGGPASARVTATWRLGGTESPAGGVAFEVLTGKGTVSATTGADGVADVAFDTRPDPGAVVDIVSRGSSLATGSLDTSKRAHTKLETRWMQGQREGVLEVNVRAVRGQLVPPFAEKIVVSCMDGQRVHVTAELTGATPAHLEADLQGARYFEVFEIRPEALRVDIELKARTADGREGSFVGSFDTVPGAVWVDPNMSGDRIALVAPAPRKAAYVSFITGLGRTGGATAELREDADGFYRGSVERPMLRHGDELDVIVAGDPEEQGPGTALWPVLPAPIADATPSVWVDENLGAILPVRLIRVIDGMPAAMQGEQARVSRVRRLAVAVAVVVGLLEIALLYLEGRRAQRDLDAHFAAQADAADGVEASAAIRHMATSAAKSGSVMVTVLGAVIAILFGIVAAFVVAR